MRERALRLVFEHRKENPSEWAAIKSIAEKLGVHHESVRIWVRRAQVDAGERAGLTTEERERLHQLERENRELRRANAHPQERVCFLRDRARRSTTEMNHVHRRPARSIRGRADL